MGANEAHSRPQYLTKRQASSYNGRYSEQALDNSVQHQSGRTNMKVFIKQPRFKRIQRTWKETRKGIDRRTTRQFVIEVTHGSNQDSM